MAASVKLCLHCDTYYDPFKVHVCPADAAGTDLDLPSIAQAMWDDPNDGYVTPGYVKRHQCNATEVHQVDPKGPGPFTREWGNHATPRSPARNVHARLSREARASKWLSECPEFTREWGDHDPDYPLNLGANRPLGPENKTLDEAMREHGGPVVEYPPCHYVPPLDAHGAANGSAKREAEARATGDPDADVKNPTHYSQFKIEPIDFIEDNGIPYSEGNVIKYVCRWRQKDGIRDLKKARQYLDIMIRREEEEGEPI